MSPLAVDVIVALVALAAHGLFAGFVAGFSAADRGRIRQLAEAHQPNAYRLHQYAQRPELLQMTLLFGGLLSLIIAAMAVHHVIDSWWLVFLVVTSVFVVLGQIIPRSVFLLDPTRFLLALVPVMAACVSALGVVAWPLTLLARAFRKSVGAPAPEIGPFMSTEAEFLSLVDESAASGGIKKEEQEMIHSVLDLQTTQAKEIMVPRIDIKAIPDTATRAELVQLFEETGLTRIPIYHESIDDVLGVANAYDVLLDTETDNDDIRRFARDVVHVPDTMAAGDVMQQLKQAHQHMAIVTDEYGGTYGIITLEDTLEEIFGEIHDEHDRAMDMIRQVGPRGYVIDARMPLEDVAAQLNVPLEDEDVETIGGWVMHAAGRIPDQGEKFRHGGFRVTVLEGQRHQIMKIRLDVLDDHRDSIEEKRETDAEK